VRYWVYVLISTDLLPLGMRRYYCKS